jgi:phage antirepressor YoqD-like protein
MNTKREIKLKAVISVTDTAKLLNLSRSRIYQLIDSGILPKPILCEICNRPYYTKALQKKCLQIKETNIGNNGKPILFYTPRKKL